MASTKSRTPTNQISSTAASRLLEKRLVARTLSASQQICVGLVPEQATGPDDYNALLAQSRLLTIQLLVLVFADARQLLPEASSEALHRLQSDQSDDLSEFRECIHSLTRGEGRRDSGGLFDHRVPAEAACPLGLLRTALDILATPPAGQLPFDFKRLPVSLIGRCYESLLDVHVESVDGEMSFSIATQGRKASGKFFTPPSLVDYIVRGTLEPAAQEAMFGCPPEEAPGRLLALKILDPSCGCGDFLVAAARFIGQAIASRVGSPVDQWVCQAAEKCVYGVDSDPIAVAISQAALWLDAGIPGEAYWRSGNVRCGNSLIGACLHDVICPPDPRKRQISVIKSQPNLLQGHVLSRTERLVGAGLDGQAPTSLRRMSDVWMSSYMLNAVNPKEYAEAALADDDDWFSSSDTAGRAAELAESKGFFHWDSEFPEVFFDQNGIRPDPGFDAVIGNPPYVAAKNEDMSDYLRIHGGDGQSDYYLLFLSNMVNRRLVRRGGYLSMVIPDPFLVRGNAAGIRRTLVKDWTMSSILHIKGMFPGAGVSNAIPVCRNLSAADYSITVRRVDTGAGISRFVDGYADYHEFHTLPANLALAQPGCELLYLADGLSEFRDSKRFAPLGQMGVRIYRGEEIGKRAISSNLGELPILLGGQSIRPFQINWEGRRINRATVKKPLERYLCEKLVLQKSAGRITAALDTPCDDHPGYVLPQSVYSISCLPVGPNPYYLLALLNSDALNDYVFRMFTGYKLIQPQIEIEDLKRLPIPIINFATPDEIRERLVSDVWACPENITAVASDWLKSGQEDVVHDLIVRLSKEMCRCSALGYSTDDKRSLLNEIVEALFHCPSDTSLGGHAVAVQSSG